MIMNFFTGNERGVCIFITVVIIGSVFPPSDEYRQDPFMSLLINISNIFKTLIIPAISMADCVPIRRLFDNLLHHQIIWQPYYNLLEVLTIFPLFTLSCVNGNAICFHGVNKFHTSLANVLLTVL